MKNTPSPGLQGIAGKKRSDIYTTIALIEFKVLPFKELYLFIGKDCVFEHHRRW